jgi:chromosomal replication initiation ATPase DnaA
MPRKPEQMPFNLASPVAYAREDFHVSPCNAEAWGWMEKWPDWGAPTLVLHGPPASGKTHLARIWLEKVGEKGRVIEDADRFAGTEKEKELFHLYNVARETGGYLLLTAALPPAEWNIALPDLKSRLLAAPSAALRAPDDALLAVVMAKMFSDRQILVPQEVIAYVLPRMERSFAAARTLVEAIDRKALAEKRAVTVPLVRDLLD